jgi:hypothetical protein
MSLNWKLRGFDYTSYYRGGYTNADSMAGLVATGANAIETTLDWGIDPTTNTVYADSSYTDPLSAEANVIKEAVAKGLQVMVKPHIDFLNASKLVGTPYSVGDWRTYYNPGAAGSAGANAFFASYKTMILSEAQVAAANGATLFCIGTELDQLAGPAYKSYWDAIISAIRTQDPNLKLTFAADWNDALSPWQYGGSGLPVGTGSLATQISFASELDYLGLDVYAPLANTTTPTLQQLINGWTQTPDKNGTYTSETYDVTGNQSLISYFESLSAELGKPLLFTEVGFENATDAAENPAGTQTNAEDDKLQSLAYQSLFDAFSQSGDASVAGAFLYNWDPNASEVGPGSIAFSPQNLPALSAVDAAFAAPVFTLPATVEAGLNIPVAVPNLSLSGTGSVFTVKLTASDGVLSVSGPASVTGAGTASLVVSGSLANVNATLATLSYTQTKAANDVIAAIASADGGPAGAANIAVNEDGKFPVLSFAYDTYVSGATVDLSGTANTANAGRTVNYDVNLVKTASATVAADGTFSSPLTLSTTAVNVVQAQLTDANGGTGASSPLMISLADGLTLTFSASNGNVADIFNATAAGDTVNGANGTIVLSKAKAAINGGGDTIYTDGAATDAATLAGTAGAWDTLQGSNAALTLDGAQASVVGGNDSVQLDGSVSDAASLYDTNNAWDVVRGANGAVILTDAKVSIVGGSDAIYLSGANDNAASLYSTGGAWDLVQGANGSVYLTDAKASVVGGGDVVYLSGAADNAASLYSTAGAWDLVQGSNASLSLIDAQASVVGGGDVVYLSGAADNAVSLYNTGGQADLVYGANGFISLSNAQAGVSGASETFGFAAAYGQDTLAGFVSSDVLQFSKSDWADYAHLLSSGALTQGANGATITSGANVLTLTGVSASSLTQANFHFV